MKTVVLLLSAAVNLLGGCATNAAPDATVEVVDTQKVQAIERAAQKYNVKVIWLNQPTKRVLVNTAESRG